MLAFFENLVDPFPEATPEKPPRTLLAFLWHYSRPIAPHLLFASFSAALFAVLEVALFGFLGNLIDFFTASNRETFWTDHLWWMIGVGVLIIVIMPLLEVAHGLVTNQCIMSNFPMRIRWLAHRYLLRQSMSFFQDDFAGRVATKVMQSALAVRDVAARTTEVFVYVTVYFMGALVLFAQSDWRIMAPLATWFVVYAATMRYFIPRMRDISKRQADARSDVTGRVVDSYTNIQTVKLFAHAAYEESYARESMTPFLETAYEQFRLVTWLNVVLESLNGLLLFSIGLIGIWLWTEQAATAGAVALAVGLVLRLKGMSHWVMWEIATLFENIGTVQDGVETIAREHDLVDRPEAQPLKIDQGGISFDRVRFHYGKESGVLDDLSLTVAPGEKIGLVGPSGAGKSTVVNLLLRFYDTESGRILIDGQDVAGVSQESLRAAIGLVSQDTSLLHRSVRDNIRYGRPDAGEAAIISALTAAKADAFITDLADLKGRTGLDAHVGERGVKLSGGQRQRIAIARVILKDAPILVLDEATSALDSEVEAAIQDSLTELMAGKTVIAIAHRLSTIAAMDRLIVMDQGRIAEQGTHDELLAANGLYARLWARQSGGFLNLEAGASAASNTAA
ncbi:MAG: ABC transporter ATP-binding protein [Rhodospirillaceae bacterium]|jgi:ATP-binding cassette, subfamily B, multidrug efflux pump|nr:ABC transporter ATP-binding protein [Rhodospirillaceae bacterium]MBT6140316.1 ABC transporter ATP-binding protein [Rhodospirillaceae bacterium]